ncbi:MAG: DNA mismatch repair protein MutS [Planctomycetes bacterium]|nr:DNA mismatch repair protein MutS [Planctomycetota bacterium]
MAVKEEKLTPAMKQFHHFKQKHPDAILFFRMGDFYETFYEDARTCSKVCGLTLTSRSKGANPIPLAGMPYHAVDGYLKKMLQAGYKVAVCEQVEDPKQAKGVVKRDVVRIVTPGTLTDDMLLESKEDNFLCAVSLGKKSTAAISWVDISTGHFFVQTISEDKVLDELIRLSPAECLLADTRGELFEAEMKKLAKDITQLTGAIVTERPGWYFDPYQSRQKLLKHFGTATLEGFGISDGDETIAVAGAIIEYLTETQKTALSHIQNLKKVNRKEFLQIDQTSLASLEILRTIRGESAKGSLLDCIDETLTGMGARMFRGMLCMPLCEIKAIEQRQDAIADLMQTETMLSDIRQLFLNISDLERIAARVSTYRANPRDLLALEATLRQVPKLRGLLKQSNAELLLQLADSCDSMDELADLLETAIELNCPTHLRDGGVIKAGFSDKLDSLRSISKDGRNWLAEYQKQQIELTGISNLKIGFNRVFGYYIEVNHSAAEKVPEDYIRKQTIKNAERYITEELKVYETKALDASEKALELEVQLFEQLRNQTAQYVPRLQKLADTIARCDCLSALGYLAARRNYTRPKITDGGELLITEGKHPVLAESLGAEFVPNDIELGEKSGDVMVITGPNMSGKSTYIRQSALLVLMAQTGSFIPAKQATIGVVDRIFTRVGASDELTRGQSTFMVEMTETANIINNATKRSLVVLDEVGRGTSTYDGLSLAWAITEHIATKIKCRTLFATHYHELTELSELFENVKNCNVAVREWADEVVFLHRILPGGTDKSYGIHVAKLAGLPKPILERSKEILEELESTFQKEASGEHLAKHKTKEPDSDTLFVQKHKSVLDKLASMDVNNLTPIEAINLLNKIKDEIDRA